MTPYRVHKGNCAPSAEENDKKFAKAMSTFPKETEPLLSLPTLTEEDWVEIYYALRTKLGSASLQGNDREARDWREHIKDILETIGPDGKNMVSQ